VILNKGTEMKKILTALGTASLFALTACGGGGSEGEANNATAATQDVTLPADENLALPADANLGADANALATTNTTDANLGADANLTGNATDAGNASGNAIGNATGNTQ
jgi:Na+-transporting NADH:ubiquinone oxidoreductase subunit NqrF